MNTVVLRDGRRIGHNTDCLGFAEGFRRGLADAPRQRVVQMGAGGAGAAVAHALLAEGVERLVLFDVDPARAQALADNLNQHFGAPRALAGSDLAGALGDARDWSTPPRWAWPSYPACRCRRNCCAPTCGSPR